MRTGLYTEKVVLTGSTDPQAFFVPPKCRIDGIIFEKRGSQSGTMHMGTSYTPPVAEKATISNITAAVGGGILTITLKSTAGTKTATVEVAGGETAAEVAALIAAASIEGWGAGTVVEAGGSYSVEFTSTEYAAVTGSYSFDGGGTGITTGQPYIVTPGADSVPAVAEEFSLEITVAPTTEGSVTVAGTSIMLDPAVHTTAAIAALEIAAAEFADYTAVQGGAGFENFVYFTAKIPGVLGDATFTDNGTAAEAETAITLEGAAATIETATATVTVAPTAAGNITVAGELIAVLETDTAVDVAGKVVTALAANATWDVVQGVDVGVDDHIVYFTAKAAGAVADVEFEDTGTTSTDIAINITPGADATTETNTLTVTAVPVRAGNVTVANVEVALDPAIHTTEVLVAQAIAAADYSTSGWTALQGVDVGVDDHIVTFTATAPGEHAHVAFEDDATLTEATALVTQQGSDEVAAVAEIVALPKPTAPSAPGEIMLTIGTDTAEIALEGDETAEAVIALILGAAFSGYTSSEAGEVIRFTSDVAGVLSGKTYAVSYGTGVTASVAGDGLGADYIVTDDVLPSTALPTTHMETKALSVTKSAFSMTGKTPVLVKVDTANCLGTLHVSYEKFA